MNQNKIIDDQFNGGMIRAVKGFFMNKPNKPTSSSDEQANSFDFTPLLSTGNSQNVPVPIGVPYAPDQSIKQSQQQNKKDVSATSKDSLLQEAKLQQQKLLNLKQELNNYGNKLKAVAEKKELEKRIAQIETDKQAIAKKTELYEQLRTKKTELEKKQQLEQLEKQKKQYNKQKQDNLIQMQLDTRNKAQQYLQKLEQHKKQLEQHKQYLQQKKASQWSQMRIDNLIPPSSKNQESNEPIDFADKAVKEYNLANGLSNGYTDQYGYDNQYRYKSIYNNETWPNENPEEIQIKRDWFNEDQPDSNQTNGQLLSQQTGQKQEIIEWDTVDWNTISYNENTVFVNEIPLIDINFRRFIGYYQDNRNNDDEDAKSFIQRMTDLYNKNIEQQLEQQKNQAKIAQLKAKIEELIQQDQNKRNQLVQKQQTKIDEINKINAQINEINTQIAKDKEIQAKAKEAKAKYDNKKKELQAQLLRLQEAAEETFRKRKEETEETIRKLEIGEEGINEKLKSRKDMVEIIKQKREELTKLEEANKAAEAAQKKAEEEAKKLQQAKEKMIQYVQSQRKDIEDMKQQAQNQRKQLEELTKLKEKNDQIEKMKQQLCEQNNNEKSISFLTRCIIEHNKTDFRDYFFLEQDEAKKYKLRQYEKDNYILQMTLINNTYYQNELYNDMTIKQWQYGRYIDQNLNTSQIHPFFTNFNKYYKFDNYKYYEQQKLRDITAQGKGEKNFVNRHSFQDANNICDIVLNLCIYAYNMLGLKIKAEFQFPVPNPNDKTKTEIKISPIYQHTQDENNIDLFYNLIYIPDHFKCEMSIDNKEYLEIDSLYIYGSNVIQRVQKCQNCCGFYASFALLFVILGDWIDKGKLNKNKLYNCIKYIQEVYHNNNNTQQGISQLIREYVESIITYHDKVIINDKHNTYNNPHCIRDLIIDIDNLIKTEGSDFKQSFTINGINLSYQLNDNLQYIL